jgi:GNAT superfamily N-acetyltransferase
MVLKVTTDEQILATREVIRQLQPNVPFDEYLATVKRMKQTDGYQLAALYDKDTVRAVAGYRVMEMLHYGRIMYIDDLNTDERCRSKGYGKILLDWLKVEARAQSCGQLHLNSGVQREQTHRFYFREGMTISCHHFHMTL